jgi:hypothetical protein
MLFSSPRLRLSPFVPVDSKRNKIACYILLLFNNILGGIMIDFTIPEETKAVRDKVRAFVQSECHPGRRNLHRRQL